MGPDERETEPRCYLTGQVVAAYSQVRLTPRDCLPDRQVKSAAGALHLALFKQPGKDDSFSSLLEPSCGTGVARRVDTKILLILYSICPQSTACESKKRRLCQGQKLCPKRINEK
jgi:hypothetical protein